MEKSRIYLLFAKGPGVTGQQIVSEFTTRAFTRLGVECTEVWLPVLDRLSKDRSKFLCWLHYGWDVLKTWGQSMKYALVRRSTFIHVIGQSWVALVRDFVPLLACSVGGFRRNLLITALHSNIFTEWPLDCLKLKFFRWYLKRSDRVLALGTQQRLHLLRMGLEGKKVVVFPNTCDVHAITQEALERKHRAADRVECLFLSNLIDTKGYPQYVEACEALGAVGLSFQAVLCGPYVDSGFNKRFVNFSEVSNFVEKAKQHVNASSTASLEWIPGARGEAKQALFDAAQVFVFPTCITGEAQPLVIIEAMATGAAIITSRFREVPDLVDDDSALLLDEVTTQTVAQAMERLIKDPELRIRLATNALKRFQERFSFDSFVERWRVLLDECVDVS